MVECCYSEWWTSIISHRCDFLIALGFMQAEVGLSSRRRIVTGERIHTVPLCLCTEESGAIVAEKAGHTL